jgi:lysophospholipase L1-like esterase
MLVLGDSTAVGVGATSSTNVPGRLAEHLHASVENYAKSGAKVGWLTEQRMRAKRAHYDTTLVQIGANDVVSTGNLTVAAAVFEKELAALTKMSGRVIVLTAGDIGDSGVFIRPLGAVISYRTRVLREYFKKTCEKYGAVYVDIYAEPNVLARDPGRYYAADNFHLSSEGYGYWYEITKKYITK